MSTTHRFSSCYFGPKATGADGAAGEYRPAAAVSTSTEGGYPSVVLWGVELLVAMHSIAQHHSNFLMTLHAPVLPHVPAQQIAFRLGMRARRTKMVGCVVSSCAALQVELGLLCTSPGQLLGNRQVHVPVPDDLIDPLVNQGNGFHSSIEHLVDVKLVG